MVWYSHFLKNFPQFVEIHTVKGFGIINKAEGEKKRYKCLNAEFQRIARRDKKAFFSDPCKEIEEKNKMGKTRDFFKKIRDTKGTFHAKMDSIKEEMVWT